MYCNTKLHKNEWNVYNVCKPQKMCSQKKVSVNLEKDVCKYFKMKNKLGMCVRRCEIKLN